MSEACAEMDRLTLGPIENPVRGMLHGGAAAVALVLVGRLPLNDPSYPYPWAFGLFATTQAALYLTSTLYHTVPWRPAAKARMQRLDHAMIHVAVAGIVTGIVLLGLSGPLRTAVIASTWTLALVGASQKLFMKDCRPGTTLPVQVALGALALPAVPQFVLQFPGAPSVLLGFAVASFALGGVCFASRRPKAWPHVFSYHEIFHVCTVLGSGAHCLIFVRYL